MFLVSLAGSLSHAEHRVAVAEPAGMLFDILAGTVP